MSLPIDFVASATALECYESCPRRFQHRYLLHSPTAGPDPESARRMQRGELFHKLVLWHDLGLDTDVVLHNAGDPVLDEQWAAYESFQQRPGSHAGSMRHDQSLIARCAGYPVLAQVDALRCEPDGRVTIYDWKTSERPDRSRLSDSQQTRIYPYVVWHVLRGRDHPALTDPGQIRLVYWFPSHPGDPFEIAYSSERLAAATDWLEDLLTAMTDDTLFTMTHDRTRCQNCEYIAHCGVRPEDGAVVDPDEDYYRTAGLEDHSSCDHPVWPD